MSNSNALGFYDPDDLSGVGALAHAMTLMMMAAHPREVNTVQLTPEQLVVRAKFEERTTWNRAVEEKKAAKLARKGETE